ncbi:hypothetical protein HIM_00189 [Hirsutella minnesotensis 3608]|nr:hypothetical protein HIM_00189 [Hirsutella minnesotensis 3608]
MVINNVVADPAVYPQPDRFDGYRFLKMRDGEERTQAPFTTTTKTHLGFGYGKYACPGRYFAANEIKIALCHMIVKYEWRLVESSPHEMLSEGLVSFRDPRARLEVRRRESPPDIESLIGKNI